MKFLTGILLSSLLAPAMAGTIRHDANDQDYVAFGADAAFASVGAIIGTNNQGTYGCSGTAIDKHWILTAAHCVDEAQSIDFYLANAGGGFNLYQGKTWQINENFSESNLLAGWDLGLVYFDQALNVKPAQLYSGVNEVGSVSTIVGFGTTGTGLTGAVEPFGTKRAGLNMLSFAFSLEGTGEQILFGDFDPPITDNPFGAMDFFEDGYAIPYEYSPAPGDSGGGMFIFQNNQIYLAGVTSFGGDANNNNLDADYGDYFGATRVSSFSDWINERVGQKSAPEPSSLLLLVVALGGLFFRRRSY